MYKHWAHAVSPSPWPLFMAFSLNATIWGFMMWIHWGIPLLMMWGLSQMGWVFTLWVSDIMSEATFQGEHTLSTVQAFSLGFFLFILSEITFFGGFFWAYFYSSFIPSTKMGCTWPPQGMEVVSWKMAVFPTATLLWSGWLVSLAHWAVVAGNRNVALQHLMHTIWLGMLFTYIQYTEYTNCTFSMANGMYASCFFLLTGFHGIHVMVGTIFLSVQYYSLKNGHFTRHRHFGLEAAIFYWHFVDMVWLLVFFLVYAPFAGLHKKNASSYIMECKKEKKVAFNGMLPKNGGLASLTKLVSDAKNPNVTFQRHYHQLPLTSMILSS